MNAPRPVDMSRYPVFYRTPKTREVTMDSKIIFFSRKKKDLGEEITQVFKAISGFPSDRKRAIRSILGVFSTRIALEAS